jgi:hypothetical protein
MTSFPAQFSGEGRRLDELEWQLSRRRFCRPDRPERGRSVTSGRSENVTFPSYQGRPPGSAGEAVEG